MLSEVSDCGLEHVNASLQADRLLGLSEGIVW